MTWWSGPLLRMACTSQPFIDYYRAGSVTDDPLVETADAEQSPIYMSVGEADPELWQQHYQ